MSEPIAFIPDIAEEHYEELQALWLIRKRALRSWNQRRADVLRFEERIESHIQGALVPGEGAIRLYAPGLSSEEPLEAFAAAILLLRMRTPSALDRVMTAFPGAAPTALEGFSDAFAHGAGPEAIAALVDALRHAPAAHAAAISAALAFHQRREPAVSRLPEFLIHADPKIRGAGWRVASLTGEVLPPKIYAAGIRDADQQVRQESLAAAAWAKQVGVIEACRYASRQPLPDRSDLMNIVAILGGRGDLPLMTYIGQREELGPLRLELIGTFGHPSLIELVIAAMSSPDPPTANAAGLAFERMTGQPVWSETRASTAPPGADEFEVEFAAEVQLPDPAAARNYWEREGPRLGAIPRLCYGHDARGLLDDAVLDQLPMDARWSYMLRAGFFGLWQGEPWQLERFGLQ